MGEITYSGLGKTAYAGVVGEGYFMTKCLGSPPGFTLKLPVGAVFEPPLDGRSGAGLYFDSM